MSDLVYLYGFVPPDSAAPPRGLLGIDDRGVELRRLGRFDAVVSHVSRDRYGEEPVEAGLKRLEWVAEQGIRHERVVTWFVDHTCILPARLLTIYSSTDAMTRAVTERGQEIEATLARFHGLREWDLKVSYDPAEFALHLGQLSSAIAALDAEISAAAPGKRYLLEKKRDTLARTEILQAARRQATQLLTELRELVQDVAPMSIPREAEELPVVLNAGLLVPLSREAALKERLEGRRDELDAIGIHISFSGPWAPYRFVGAGDHAERGTPAVQ